MILNIKNQWNRWLKT